MLADDIATACRRAMAPDPMLIVAEIEHRVANEYALAIASVSRAARSANPEAKAALQDVSRRLQDYADAHRALQAPFGADAVDLGDYLARLLGALARASLDERGVALTLALTLVETGVTLAPARCWRVGLIVAELVTNAVRHAFGDECGAITVDIARSADRVYCRVRDNGRATRPYVAGQGTGVVDALATELGGALDRQFAAQGTTVVLSFPDPADGVGPRGETA
jgi:two-component sensor histidine kinase